MIRLVAVPIRVQVPPRIDAKDSGINDRDGLRFALLAAWMSTGMSRASAATLFMTADNTAASEDMIVMCAPRRLALETTKRASNSMAPELDSPLLTIKTSAMITTAG